MRFLSTLLIVVVTVASGCGRDGPTSPSAGPGSGGSTGGTQVTGAERLAWDQRASSPAELQSFAYLMYVDGERLAVNDVACGALGPESTAACSVRLPALSAGPHSLSLASVNAQGAESPRSGSLQVVVVRTASSTADAPVIVSPDASAATTTDAEDVRP